MNWLAKSGARHRRDLNGDPLQFRLDLEKHASGFLAPLIKNLQVRWNSPLLDAGMVLVDLPGVGVAGDAYKAATQKWINEKAKGVILVVDRSGITESADDLLRTSGFLTRLLFSADERSHDPLVLGVAAAKLDDVAETAWANDKSRRKADHLADQFNLARPMIQKQLRTQLELVWGTGDAQVRAAKRSVIDQLAQNLLVFPVSAPQSRKLLAADPDDAAFIGDKEESGVPTMQHALARLVETRRPEARSRRDESIDAWVEQAVAWTELLKQQWAGNHHSEQEVEELQRELAAFLDPLQKEFRIRQGQFREFLRETMPEKIGALVIQAKDSARVEIRKYLRSLKDVHCATLRATVRREGILSRVPQSMSICLMICLMISPRHSWSPSRRSGANR